MRRTSARLLYWSPRFLSILFALFLSVFALDVFGEVHGAGPIALALFVHLIPAIMVIAVLIIAWRWEWIGALAFALAALGYAVSVLPHHLDWVLTISLPLIVIATLFLTNWMERTQLRVLREPHTGH
ncbi:MAG TPA: hypothetical protein VHE33_04110 [Acidobacteriaceae bacterium]|nr:hypothetical protein [Acidobacteriaceae bacterium]